MTNHILLSDLKSGISVEGCYILKDAAVKLASNGRKYLSGVLSDASGEADLMMWDYQGTVGPQDVGEAVLVRGNVGEYKGSLQITGIRIQLAPEGTYELTDLVPSAPIDRDRALEYIKETVASITDDDYKKIAETLLARHLDDFAKIPAAKSVHHGFLYGLLMHTAYMLRTAEFLAKQYSTVVDRSLLIAGTVLHDLAKTEEFCISKYGLVTDYSAKGQLVGHLVAGAMSVADTAKELGIDEKKSMLLQHMILSHHGTPEHGAAVVPVCAEAELLHYIDLIDSRMEIYAENLKTMQPDTFSPKNIFALEHKIYRHK